MTKSALEVCIRDDALYKLQFLPLPLPTTRLNSTAELSLVGVVGVNGP